MSLNIYTVEVRDFLDRINSDNKNNKQKIDWLKEEFELLQYAVESSDIPKIQHQIYDMMFLLFEIAAANNLDLDSEWHTGAIKKSEKYLKEK